MTHDSHGLKDHQQLYYLLKNSSCQQQGKLEHHIIDPLWG